MATRTLMDSEAWTIANALRIAAIQYDADAETYANPSSANGHMPVDARMSLKRQFKDQADMARKLAGEFEGAQSVVVEE